MTWDNSQSWHLQRFCESRTPRLRYWQVDNGKIELKNRPDLKAKLNSWSISGLNPASLPFLNIYYIPGITLQALEKWKAQLPVWGWGGEGRLAYVSPGMWVHDWENSVSATGRMQVGRAWAALWECSCALGLGRMSATQATRLLGILAALRTQGFAILQSRMPTWWQSQLPRMPH